MTPDLDTLREIVKARVPQKRALHILCVEREADALAWRWNADRQAARQAALLHDVTKGIPEDIQLKLCEKYDIVAMPWEKGKLLHAVTGAALAKYEFHMPDSVVRAVRWHTTGRAGMSLLEKIIYLADYVDSTRGFHGARALRRLCYEDVNAALRLGLEHSIRNLLDAGRPICPSSLEAYNHEANR
jgi:nicotinate-nucleotide adenylyltransferase